MDIIISFIRNVMDEEDVLDLVSDEDPLVAEREDNQVMHVLTNETHDEPAVPNTVGLEDCDWANPHSTASSDGWPNPEGNVSDETIDYSESESGSLTPPNHRDTVSKFVHNIGVGCSPSHFIAQ
jgi:hypothetical protein